MALNYALKAWKKAWKKARKCKKDKKHLTRARDCINFAANLADDGFSRRLRDNNDKKTFNPHIYIRLTTDFNHQRRTCAYDSWCACPDDYRRQSRRRYAAR